MSQQFFKDPSQLLKQGSLRERRRGGGKALITPKEIVLEIAITGLQKTLKNINSELKLDPKERLILFVALASHLKKLNTNLDRNVRENNILHSKQARLIPAITCLQKKNQDLTIKNQLLLKENEPNEIFLNYYMKVLKRLRLGLPRFGPIFSKNPFEWLVQ